MYQKSKASSSLDNLAFSQNHRNFGYEQQIQKDSKWLFYSARFDIGTPPQPFNFFLDTGSSWSWIRADNCTDAACMQSNRFHTVLSSTYEETGEKKHIQYTTGSAEGNICLDTFAFGGQRSVRADKFKFFVQYDDYFGFIGLMDAIVGLAPRDDSVGPLLIEYMYAQGHIPQK